MTAQPHDPDIVVVKPNDFYKRKGVTIDKDIQERYKKLFQDYNCFSDNAIIVIQPNHKPLPPRKHAQPNRLHDRKEPKTTKRFMMGLLNVINVENYHKLLLKAKMYINRDNAKEIFGEILEKCSSQVFYIHIYIALMRDLMNSFNESERETAIDVVRQFATEYLQEGYVLKQATKQGDSYHNFCMLQKQKMNILSKNTMMLEFMTKTDYLKNIDLASYLALIKSAFFVQIQTNTEAADVLLQAMIEIARYGVCCAKSEEFASLQVNSKLKFLITDLVEISSKHSP